MVMGDHEAVSLLPHLLKMAQDVETLSVSVTQGLDE